MKKSIVVLFVLLASASVYSQKRIKGNGKIATLERSTATYEKVTFYGSFDYILTAGQPGNIKIEGEENLLDYIITEVNQGELIVRTTNKVNIQTSLNKTIKITVPFTKLTSISLSGSGDVWNNSKIEETILNVSLNGSGDIKLNATAEEIITTVTGSGDIVLSGNTNVLNVNVTGSGDFKGFDLKAARVDVLVKGSGDAKIFATEKLKARIIGSGDISYRGQPNSEDFKVTGSGDINKAK